MLRSYPRHRSKSPQSHTITESQDRQSEVSTRSSCVSHTVLDHTHTHAQCWQVPRARTDVPPSFISSRNAASSIIARLSRCSPIITLLFNVGYSLSTHFSPSLTVARRRVSDFPSLSLSLSLYLSRFVSSKLDTWRFPSFSFSVFAESFTWVQCWCVIPLSTYFLTLFTALRYSCTNRYQADHICSYQFNFHEDLPWTNIT